MHRGMSHGADEEGTGAMINQRNDRPSAAIATILDAIRAHPGTTGRRHAAMAENGRPQPA